MFESLRKIVAPGFSVPSGTSSQFLKADGTTDATSYFPSAEPTRASIRPSLLLDFANSKTLDPRITFTRNSTASYYGKDGLLKTAAINSPRFDHNSTTGESLGLLIEEQRTNLLTYSEQFDNAAWGKSYVIITPNTTTAPDGTVTADTLIEDTSNFLHYILIGFTSSVQSYSYSIFAKSFSGNRRLTIRDGGTGAYATFDLSSASVVGSSAATGIIQVFSNGWFRCICTFTAIATGTSIQFFIQRSIDTGILAYPGDGTSGIYIWGAQLEVGAFPTSYIPSTDTFTSRATTGTYIGSNGLIQTAAINTARLNYNPLNLALSPKLLLESASTNLLTYSEQFDNAIWENVGGNTGISVTANNTTSPDGTVNADKITNDAGATSLFYYPLTVAASSTTDYTATVFVKAGTATRFVFNCYYLGNTEDNITFDLTTCTILGGNTLANQAAIVAMGNGWCRISYVLTRDATGTRTTILFRGWGIGSGVRGNGVIGEYYYIWGAQLETGNTATSYIPTTSAQVTRAADVSSSAQSTRIADSAVMTGTNFSNWYRQDEGTFTTKSDSNYSTSSATEQIIYNVSDNSTSNFINGSRINASNRFYGTTNTSSQFDLTSGTYTTQSLHSNTYKLNSINTSYNGATVTTDTSAIIPSVNKITLGASTTGNYLNGHISKLAYYPKQLTNAELITLSTV